VKNWKVNLSKVKLVLVYSGCLYVLGIPILIASIVLAVWLVFALWDGNWMWLLPITVIISLIFYTTLIFLGIYFSKFWQSRRPVVRKIVWWSLTGLMLLGIIWAGIAESTRSISSMFLAGSGEISVEKAQISVIVSLSWNFLFCLLGLLYFWVERLRIQVKNEFGDFRSQFKVRQST